MTVSETSGVSEHYYFAYGSNMNTERMTERAMRFDHVEGAELSDYRLVFNKRSVKFPGTASANVMVGPGHGVEGVLYRLADELEIYKMDPYEGYPVRYNRFLLPVTTRSEHQAAAWVYVANRDYIDDSLMPPRWYLDHLLAGKPYLTEAYYDRLQQEPCLD